MKLISDIIVAQISFFGKDYVLYSMLMNTLETQFITEVNNSTQIKYNLCSKYKSVGSLVWRKLTPDFASSPDWRTVRPCSFLIASLLVFVRNNTNEFLIKNLSLWSSSILGKLYLKRNTDIISLARGKYTRVIVHGSSEFSLHGSNFSTLSLVILACPLYNGGCNHNRCIRLQKENHVTNGLAHSKPLINVSWYLYHHHYHHCNHPHLHQSNF